MQYWEVRIEFLGWNVTWTCLHETHSWMHMFVCRWTMLFPLVKDVYGLICELGAVDVMCVCFPVSVFFSWPQASPKTIREVQASRWYRRVSFINKARDGRQIPLSWLRGSGRPVTQLPFWPPELADSRPREVIALSFCQRRGGCGIAPCCKGQYKLTSYRWRGRPESSAAQRDKVGFKHTLLTFKKRKITNYIS